jgi:hypothetical protein
MSNIQSDTAQAAGRLAGTSVISAGKRASVSPRLITLRETGTLTRMFPSADSARLTFLPSG